MNKIIPMRQNASGEAVAELHATLRALLTHGLLYQGDTAKRETALTSLRGDFSKQILGIDTERVLNQYQKERGLTAYAGVDVPTANILNIELMALGLLTEKVATPVLTLDAQVEIRCVVVNSRGTAIAGIEVEPRHEMASKVRKAIAEPQTSDAQGTVTFRLGQSRYAELTGAGPLNLCFIARRGQHVLAHILIKDAGADGILQNFAVSNNPVQIQIGKPNVVHGRILQGNGVPASKLTVKLYGIGFGAKRFDLQSSDETDDTGRYSIAFERQHGLQILQVLVTDTTGKELQSSKPIDDASTLLEVNLQVKTQAMTPEYNRLADDLLPHIENKIENLGNAKEDSNQQDLTALNRLTGWDARLIALAAITQKLAADSDIKKSQLSTDALYGLARLGLPTDASLLALVPSEAIKAALEKARNAGIISIDDVGIKASVAQFNAFSGIKKLKLELSGSKSSYGDLLSQSGINPDDQEKFARIYFNHRGSSDALWKAAHDAGMAPAEIGKLQMQGKLTFLAGNSAAMTNRLLNKKNIKTPAELAAQGLHSAAAWKAELFAEAGIAGTNQTTPLSEVDRKKLEPMIPSTYVGDQLESRIDAYAHDMARKVRRSYPTQVLGHLMTSDQNYKKLAGTTGGEWLNSADAIGFRLGVEPVDAYFRARLTQEKFKEFENGPLRAELTTLQRLYQITPDHESMPVLKAMKVSSAFEVMALPEEKFIQQFDRQYSSIHGVTAPQGWAQLVRRKSEQVSNVTYNLFAIASKLNTESPVAALSTPAQRETVKEELLKHYPTMESLFGSMDYCECEHCRSVLSPAAYFVDLLQFVDSEPDATTESPSNPYDVLIKRRPDLPHLSLTCENTHTALPYIDIVNEILEYYVANQKLEQAAAHDTGDASTEELLAEPQNIIPEAYAAEPDAVGGAHYPLNLPFDLWIETARQFCAYFEYPLHRILEVFRPTNDLFSSSQPFDRSAIFLESLGLAPAEIALFGNMDPIVKWHELYGFDDALESTTEATDVNTGQRTDLKSAKALSRRLGVTYKDITEIVQTSFVNPGLAELHLLHKLGISVRSAELYKDEKKFYDDNKGSYDVLLGKERNTLDSEQIKKSEEFDGTRPSRDMTGWQVLGEITELERRLERMAAAAAVNANDLRTAIQDIDFKRVLVLADPDAGCNFDLTILQFADGTPAGATTFLRINLFVRIWRKLGWSIEELDRALTTFMPKQDNGMRDESYFAGRPFLTALIYLAHFKTLDETLNIGQQSRLKLLTLWSDLATTGTRPLYAQLFLNRSMLQASKVFDHPLGLYLSDASIPLKDHLLALQGALSLTAEEVADILGDADLVLDAVKLTLPHVSLLYRYSLLAKALKLSVRELIALKQLSGLDPFKPLVPGSLTALDQDHPYTQTLEFIKVTKEVMDSGLKIEDLDYLLRHRYDGAGKYRPQQDTTMALLKAIAAGVNLIHSEHVVPTSPDAVSEDWLRQKLGLVLPTAVVNELLGLVNGTAEFTASVHHVEKINQLSLASFTQEEQIRRVIYREIPNKEQQLTIRGVLSGSEKTALMDRVQNGLPTATRAVFSELLDRIQNASESKVREIFDNHLKLQTLRITGETGFLADDAFGTLFSAVAPQDQRELQRRWHAIAQAFMPVLRQRLVRQFIVQTMVVAMGAEAGLLESLITDKRMVALPEAVRDALAAPAEYGVDATFWLSSDASNGRQEVIASPDVSTSTNNTSGQALRPIGADSARFEGYLEVPASGAYRFFIELDKQGAKAELSFPHRLGVPVLVKGEATTERATLGDGVGEFLELKAGVLYGFRLDLTDLNGGHARLLVQGETLARGPVTQLALYRKSAIHAAERAMLLLNKALLFVQPLGLTEREVRYLLTQPGSINFDGANLSDLPTVRVGDNQDDRAASVPRFGQFRRLAAYVRLKREFAGGTADLIDIFEAEASTAADRLEQQVYPLIATLTHRSLSTVRETAAALFDAATPASFKSEQPLWRLWEALQVVERFGVPASTLKSWTGIVRANSPADSTTVSQYNTNRYAIACALKNAIRSRFDPQAWQRVAQPIFNNLRQRQRDALVSQVMHQHKFDRVEQLYEHFLIDPGMEPMVQTSRIRLAISSVQLFIQRTLLNLEKDLRPSAIDSKHWAWMKRYRVWEANRKIFLFPENWLEPEFRDDKTHLYTELEGALLQGDVSNDLVEDAFFNYLKKLDELARLDICAMHIEDADRAEDRILHVFGRTFSQPHKYFYRRLVHEAWTPWEPVSAQIEGDHLAPVIWRDRLYLFWVTFLEKAQQPVNGTKLREGMTIQSPMIDIKVTLHWCEYFNGSWSAQESSDHKKSGTIAHVAHGGFNAKSVFLHIKKDLNNSSDHGLYVHIYYAGEIIAISKEQVAAFYLAGKNSEPVFLDLNGKIVLPPKHNFDTASSFDTNRYRGHDLLGAKYASLIESSNGSGNSREVIESAVDLIKRKGNYLLIACNNEIKLSIPDEAYRESTNSSAVKSAIKHGLSDIQSLSKPAFYQDNQNTLFIVPEVSETTIEEWREWVTPPSLIEFEWTYLDQWQGGPVISEIPWRPSDLPPGGPQPWPIKPGPIDQSTTLQDWLINPTSAVQFGEVQIGSTGKIGVEMNTADRNAFDMNVVSSAGFNPRRTS